MSEPHDLNWHIEQARLRREAEAREAQVNHEQHRREQSERARQFAQLLADFRDTMKHEDIPASAIYRYTGTAAFSDKSKYRRTNFQGWLLDQEEASEYGSPGQGIVLLTGGKLVTTNVGAQVRGDAPLYPANDSSPWVIKVGDSREYGLRSRWNFLYFINESPLTYSGYSITPETIAEAVLTYRHWTNK